jgi:uncharacterized protein (TIGR00251 family)
VPGKASLEPATVVSFGLGMEIKHHGDEIVFAVWVAPRASRNAIEGEYQDALRVRLTAPPVDDRASVALRRLLAGRLNVPVSTVRIVSGEKSRMKKVGVAGVSREQMAALFETAKS